MRLPLAALLAPLAVLLAVHPALALKIATSLQWIEHTPQPYAISHFYKGSTTATLSSGGVQSLGSDTSLDLAANAETQGLKTYASHKNIRLIYIICEVAYRLVANKGAGIATLADLKGKKIGTMPGTSAAVFVNRMMASAGVVQGEYSVVSGNVCMKAPCGAGTLPAMLQSRQIDAFGIWEPAVELGAQALGANAVLFQNASVYREVYALYSTAEKLGNAATRRDIVAYVRALNQTLGVFKESPEANGVYDFVAQRVGMDASVVKAVWPDHKWSGTWGSDLINFLVDEDKYLAGTDRRSAMSKADLEKFLDSSVIAEL